MLKFLPQCQTFFVSGGGGAFARGALECLPPLLLLSIYANCSPVKACIRLVTRTEVVVVAMMPEMYWKTIRSKILVIFHKSMTIAFDFPFLAMMGRFHLSFYVVGVKTKIQ